jgi:hypothetical protein
MNSGGVRRSSIIAMGDPLCLGRAPALRSGFGGVWGFPQARLDARQKVSAHDLNAASRPEKGLKVTGGRSMP